MSTQVLQLPSTKVAVNTAERYKMGFITSAGLNRGGETNHDHILTQPYVKKTVEKETNQDYILTQPFTGKEDEDLIMLSLIDGISKSNPDNKLLQESKKMLAAWFLSLTKGEIGEPMILERKYTQLLRDINRSFLGSNPPIQTGIATVIRGKEATFAAVNGTCSVFSKGSDCYGYAKLKSTSPNVGERLSADYPLFPVITVYDNADYDEFILTTHGITDSVTTEQMSEITDDKNMSGDNKDMLYFLTEVLSEAYRPACERENLNSMPDATALVYTRK